MTVMRRRRPSAMAYTPEAPSGPPPVSLPADVRDEITHRARTSGRTKAQVLTQLVRYGLATMPPDWQP